VASPRFTMACFKVGVAMTETIMARQNSEIKKRLNMMDMIALLEERLSLNLIKRPFICLREIKIT